MIKLRLAQHVGARSKRPYCANRQKSQRNGMGFTIIELLIATMVFSAVLMLITFGVIRFNQAYYKGIVETNTQNTARLVLENVGQAIQFSGESVTSPIGSSGSSKGFCVGDQRYSYILGWQLVDGSASATLHQTKHVLVQDAPGLCGGLNAQNVQGGSVNGTEMLGPKMRLSKLSVTPVAGTQLYNIDVRVVYGDDDLLRSPSGASPAATAQDAICKSQAGSQFCAVSELSTVVQKRIN
jgi:type II secretory pathway pseudopilin PulG